MYRNPKRLNALLFKQTNKQNTTTNYTIHAKCMIYCQGQAMTKCLHVYYKYTKHCTENRDVQIYYSQQYLSRVSFFTMIASIGNFQERLKINEYIISKISWFQKKSPCSVSVLDFATERNMKTPTLSDCV